MRGISIAFNTIVIAIIAVIVLIVVVLIFRSGAQLPGQLYENCGEGVYAEFACMDEDDSRVGPLCAGERGCGTGSVCCPVERGSSDPGGSDEG